MRILLNIPKRIAAEAPLESTLESNDKEAIPVAAESNQNETPALVAAGSKETEPMPAEMEAQNAPEGRRPKSRIRFAKPVVKMMADRMAARRANRQQE